MSNKTVCVDLDGVLAKFDKWEGVEKFGPVIPAARFFLEELRREGFRIVIHTVRCSPEVNPPDVGITQWLPGVWEKRLVTFVRDWLDANNLPFDEIWSGYGKPLADVYIDDRAVSCVPLSDDDEEFNKTSSFKLAVIEARRIAHHPPAYFWADKAEKKEPAQ